ncbi:MAG: hypothetical protein R3C40_09265 [Parvularculaceae bacterium]
MNGINSFTTAKNVYTQIEKGSKSSAQSRQWFGSKKEFRRNDQLLQYMFQARDDDEHGLDLPVAIRPAQIEIGASGPNPSHYFRIDRAATQNFVMENCIFGDSGEGAIKFIGDTPHDIRITSLDGGTVAVQHQAEAIELKPVIGRGDVTYNPPTEHLGRHLVLRDPLFIAGLYLDYLDGLVGEAAKRA